MKIEIGPPGRFTTRAAAHAPPRPAARLAAAQLRQQSSKARKRVVASLAGLPQAPTVTGEGHFTGGQSKQVAHPTRKLRRHRVGACAPLEHRRLEFEDRPPRNPHRIPRRFPHVCQLAVESDGGHRKLATAALGSLQRALKWIPLVALLTAQ